MRIGIDVDGVLANFFKAYEELTIQVVGRDLFGKNRWPDKLPPTWNWPEHYGYRSRDMQKVWDVIKSSQDFWLRMEPFEGASGFLDGVYGNDRVKEVYFITDRPGVHAQDQTAGWFNNLGWPGAAVIISGPWARKGQIAAGLALDAYLDDKGENILDVLDKAPNTQTFLLAYPYNAHLHTEIGAKGGRIINAKEEFLGII